MVTQVIKISQHENKGVYWPRGGVTSFVNNNFIFEGVSRVSVWHKFQSLACLNYFKWINLIKSWIRSILSVRFVKRTDQSTRVQSVAIPTVPSSATDQKNMDDAHKDFIVTWLRITFKMIQQSILKLEEKQWN